MANRLVMSKLMAKMAHTWPEASRIYRVLLLRMRPSWVLVR